MGFIYLNNTEGTSGCLQSSERYPDEDIDRMLMQFSFVFHAQRVVKNHILAQEMNWTKLDVSNCG